MSKEIVMLEYSEKQGCFHNNMFNSNGTWDYPLFSNGWRPICIIPNEFIVSRTDSGYGKVLEECVNSKCTFEEAYNKVVSFIANHAQ